MKLRRIDQSGRETLGHLCTDEEQVICVTLERPDLGNAPKVSRILAGTYTFRRVHSQHFGCDVFRADDQNGRSNVEIHYGNYVTDSEGCILTGTTFADINGDGVMDQSGSRAAFQKFMAVMTGIDTFTLEVIDPDITQAAAA